MEAISIGPLRAICNAWCTPRRFGLADGPCVLGGADCGHDRIRHYFECPTAVNCLAAATGIWWGGPGDAFLRRKLLLDRVPRLDALLLAVAQDLIHYTVNASRSAGRAGSPEAALGFMRARLRELHRLSEPLHRLLNHRAHVDRR